MFGRAGRAYVASSATRNGRRERWRAMDLLLPPLAPRAIGRGGLIALVLGAVAVAPASADTTALDWGNGPLGVYTKPANGGLVPFPLSLPSGVTVTEVSLGEASDIALLSNGTAMAWG